MTVNYKIIGFHINLGYFIVIDSSFSTMAVSARIIGKYQSRAFGCNVLYVPDNGCVNLILSVLENSFLRRLLLVVGFLQLDLQNKKL